MGDRRILRYHAGMNALLEAALGQRGDAEQLDVESQLRGVIDIERRDMADTLDMNGVEVDRAAERDARQDGQLMRGVDAIDVEARVGLGEAQFLGLGEHLGEVAAAVPHGAQNIVAGAVENAEDAPNAIGGETLAQRLDDRNAAGDGGFVAKRGAGRLGGDGEFGAVVRNHRLVGGNQRFAAGQCRAAEIERNAVGSADQLDDGVDVGVAGQRHRVVVPSHIADVNAALTVSLARRDRRHLDAATAALGDEIGVLGEQFECAHAHRAKAGDANAQRHAHPRIR